MTSDNRFFIILYIIYDMGDIYDTGDTYTMSLILCHQNYVINNKPLDIYQKLEYILWYYTKQRCRISLSGNSFDVLLE